MLSLRPTFVFSTLLILSGANAEAGDGASETRIERWDRVICLLEPRPDAAGNAGSAFLLKGDGKLVWVTAAHVAQFTSAKSRVLFRGPDGKSHWNILGDLTSRNGQPWRFHAQADLAVMEIDGERVETERFAALAALAIPITDIVAQTPPRTTKIEIAGFPMLLGSTPEISPLVMAAEVASRELPVEAKWGHEQIIFAHPVVPNGTSGGPAFVTAESPLETRIVGLYMGYQQDNQGHRLAKLVPGHVIVELIQQQKATEWKTIAREPNQSPPQQPATAGDSAPAALKEDL